MLDDTTDLTVTKQLLITVKYYHVSSKATRYRILDLIPLSDGQAETMLVAVWNLFQECGVDLNYCYGIGADGASVTQGQKGGFIKLFLNKLQLHILIIFNTKFKKVFGKEINKEALLNKRKTLLRFN